MTLTSVLAAVVQRDDRYLICQRPPHKRHGGLWEFPGGKLEPGETHDHAARRELAEELDVDVRTVGTMLFSDRRPRLAIRDRVRAGHDPGRAQGVSSTPPYDGCRSTSCQRLTWRRATDASSNSFGPARLAPKTRPPPDSDAVARSRALRGPAHATPRGTAPRAGSRGTAELDDLRNAEAADRVAMHLAKVVEAAIENVPEDERAAAGTRLARRLIELIAGEVGGSLAGMHLVEPARMLRAIRSSSRTAASPASKSR